MLLLLLLLLLLRFPTRHLVRTLRTGKEAGAKAEEDAEGEEGNLAAAAAAGAAAAEAAEEEVEEVQQEEEEEAAAEEEYRGRGDDLVLIVLSPFVLHYLFFCKNSRTLIHMREIGKKGRETRKRKRKGERDAKKRSRTRKRRSLSVSVRRSGFHYFFFSRKKQYSKSGFLPVRFRNGSALIDDTAAQRRDYRSDDAASGGYCEQRYEDD